MPTNSDFDNTIFNKKSLPQGPEWGIVSIILCPPWDEVVMLTLCSESLHRVFFRLGSRAPFHHGKSGCASNHPNRKHFWFTSRLTPADASKIDGASITKIWHFGERAERPMGDNPHLWISSLKSPVQMVAVWVEYLSDWVVFCRMLFGHKKKHPRSVRFWMREVQNAFCKRNYWMWTYWIILYLSAGISWDKGQKVECFFLEPTITGVGD